MSDDEQATPGGEDNASSPPHTPKRLAFPSTARPVYTANGKNSFIPSPFHPLEGAAGMLANATTLRTNFDRLGLNRALGWIAEELPDFATARLAADDTTSHELFVALMAMTQGGRAEGIVKKWRPNGFKAAEALYTTFIIRNAPALADHAHDQLYALRASSCQDDVLFYLHEIRRIATLFENFSGSTLSEASIVHLFIRHLDVHNADIDFLKQTWRKQGGKDPISLDAIEADLITMRQSVETTVHAEAAIFAATTHQTTRTPTVRPPPYNNSVDRQFSDRPNVDGGDDHRTRHQYRPNTRETRGPSRPYAFHAPHQHTQFNQRRTSPTTHRLFCHLHGAGGHSSDECTVLTQQRQQRDARSSPQTHQPQQRAAITDGRPQNLHNNDDAGLPFHMLSAHTGDGHSISLPPNSDVEAAITRALGTPTTHVHNNTDNNTTSHINNNSHNHRNTDNPTTNTDTTHDPMPYNDVDALVTRALGSNTTILNATNNHTTNNVPDPGHPQIPHVNYRQRRHRRTHTGRHRHGSHDTTRHTDGNDHDNDDNTPVDDNNTPTDTITNTRGTDATTAPDTTNTRRTRPPPHHHHHRLGWIHLALITGLTAAGVAVAAPDVLTACSAFIARRAGTMPKAHTDTRHAESVNDEQTLRPSAPARILVARSTALPPAPASRVIRFILDSGAQAHNCPDPSVFTPGSASLPDGQPGQPQRIIDGGGLKHHVRLCATMTGTVVATGATLTLTNMCCAPTFQVPILSVGVLRRAGYDTILDSQPRITRGSQTIPVVEADGLFYIDITPTATGPPQQPTEGVIVNDDTPDSSNADTNHTPDDAVALVVRTTPAPPPLIPDTDAISRRLARSLSCDTPTLHALFGHAGPRTLTATCQAYGIPVPRRGRPCIFCQVTNMMRAPTHNTSHGAPQFPPGQTATMDLFGKMRTTSRGGASWGILFEMTGSSYRHFAGMRDKTEVDAAIRAFHALLAAHGVQLRVLLSDDGTEFRGKAVEAAYTELGIHHQGRPSGTHVDNIERAIRQTYEEVRPALRAAGVTNASLWEEACCWAVDAHNIRVVIPNIATGRTGIPHVDLFGSYPDLTANAPFFSWIAAYDNMVENRFDSRAIVARYIGPARDRGVGAIKVLVAQHLRAVRSWRWLARPEATVKPTTLEITYPNDPTTPKQPPSPHPPPQQQSPPPDPITTPRPHLDPPRRSTRHNLGRGNIITELSPIFKELNLGF